MSLTNTAYSPLKIIHHRGRVDALRVGKHLAPIHVQIVPTNRCNQSCAGCAYRLEGYTSNKTFKVRDEIPWPRLETLIQDCESMGVKAIEITGGGEPTVYPQFLEMCRTILDADISLGLVTNGTQWSDGHTDLLLRAHWVRFSIDAAEPQTYASYRKSTPETYKRVRGCIRSMTGSKWNGRNPLIGVSFVINQDNWKEVLKAAEFAREDGADNFRISALFQSDGECYFRGFFEKARQLCQKAEQLTTGTFRVFNLFTDRVQDLQDEAPNYVYCGYSKLTTYLGADCSIYTCCNNAYNPRGYLGSFASRSFRRAWFSEELQRRLWGLDATGCERCMYNNRNRTINYLMNSNPDHVDFI